MSGALALLQKTKRNTFTLPTPEPEKKQQRYLILHGPPSKRKNHALQT
jgi:hypothetical protein